MASKEFLKALRDKLKGGNSRSIHLNVLPGRYATRLDLSNIDHINQNSSDKFLELLTTKSCFEFKLSFDEIDLNAIGNEEQKKLGLLSKRLNSICIENEDNFKEHGIKTFGFGYPLIIKRSKQDPTKVIKAPLFIWPLEIVKSTKGANTWTILRNKTRNENGRIVDAEIHSVGLNEVLLSIIKSDENITIPQINEELLEDAVIDKQELVAECYRVLKALNASAEENIKNKLLFKISEPIKTIPDSSAIESITGEPPWIHFGGVFGLYRTQKESIIADLDKLLDRYDDIDFDSLKIENYTGTTHSPVPTDPSQQEILNTLGIEQKKIIQGPPGTGKSQSLTALITNALANNLKCLVVCEKKTALEVIKSNLSRENVQLADLAALVEDINSDRDMVVSSVRDRLTSVKNSSTFNQTNYEVVKLGADNSITEINKQHKQLDKKLFQGRKWTSIVGNYLSRERQCDYTLIQKRLDYKLFLFEKDENELPEILSKLKIAKKLFAEIGVLDHPLEILSDEIFKKENPRVIELDLEAFFTKTPLDLNEINQNAKTATSAYSSWLNQHYSGYYSSVKKEIDIYFSFIKTSESEFGTSLYKNDRFTRLKTKALAAVSRKYKTLQESRLRLSESISTIKESHEKLNYFQHSYIEYPVLKDLKAFVTNIEALDCSLEEWAKTVEGIKQNYLKTFSPDHLHPAYTGHHETIKTLNSSYQRIAAQVTEKNFLKRLLSNTTNFDEQFKEISTSLAEIEILKSHIVSFRAYYDWRRFYLELSVLQQTVIKAVIESECKQWELTFENWYLFWLLSLNENRDLPKDDDHISNLIDGAPQLKQLLHASIIDNWSTRQRDALKASKSKGLNPVSLFNKRGSRNEKRNSLRKIIASDFELFTSFYPVVMVSPTVCSSILPLQEGLFDLVIFDEASQLRIEDTFPSLLRGKIHVVSGDSQQMPPSSYFQGGASLLNPSDSDNEDQVGEEQHGTRQKINAALDLADSESLLVYAENSNYKASYLQIHYRSQHPYLIDFSNHAFYGKRLIPMPPKHDYKPIKFISVNGIYEDQVNIEEAKQVVDILLNHIKPFKDAKFPSVGIATFNLYQRNLILEEIAKVRQLSAENDKKISDLGPDLFVKNLENIQGDERDIIIISTTFGKKRDGSFRQSFGPILNSNGYKLLNVIITRAKYKVFVCCSIPEEHILKYSDLLRENKNNGRGVFYAYLAYAAAVDKEHSTTREAILAQLLEGCDSRHHDIESDVYGSESPFEEEVYYRLAARVPQERLKQQHRIGGFRLDLIVKSSITGKPFLAIECDGAKYHSSNEAYAWDMFRQKHIEQQGFKFHRIWSTNWWSSPEKEVNKVVDFIHAADRDEIRNADTPNEEFYYDNFIEPITSRPVSKKKVEYSSVVTLRTPEGKIQKIRFAKIQSKNNRPDKDGVITILENSPLGANIFGKAEGEICQLGMLEVFYEIMKIE